MSSGVSEGVIAESSADVRTEVDRFLREFGQMGPIGSDEKIFVLRDEGALIGCVRRVEESGAFVLRSLLIHPRHRGNGLGERLVRALVSASARPVYCLAYDRLTGWYSTMGFRLVGDADMPRRLAMRKNSLRLQGVSVVCLVYHPSEA
jgi:N-acetylglutamate synthase-like GNAT family acetyltransferase